MLKIYINQDKLSLIFILIILKLFQKLNIDQNKKEQDKRGNNSRSLLNEIRQIVYSLYQSKEISKKAYNNIIKSIKV